MPATRRKNSAFSNPFYIGVMIVSTLFVVTVLAYLMAPNVLGQGPAHQGEGSRRLAAWLDRQGPLILGIEFVLMLASGVLAMLTDGWFSGGR